MIVLGLWCGLGLWLDSMFLMTLAGMAVAGLFGCLDRGERAEARRLPWTAASLAFVAALLAGASPRFIGKAVDPYDAYNEQFSGASSRACWPSTGGSLLLDCLPRLIAGHRLPGPRSRPRPGAPGPGRPVQRSSRGREGSGMAAVALTVLALGLFPAALLALVSVVIAGTEPGERVVAIGLLASSFAIVAGFLVNRNIFNSDNYRYLVLLAHPLGDRSGLTCCGPCRQARGWGLTAAVAVAIALAALFTVDAAAWYRRLGWIDERLVPVRRRLDHPVLRWLDEHPEVGSLYGGYWDVYRLAFLTPGRCAACPSRCSPTGSPSGQRASPAAVRETLLVRPSREGQYFLNVAMRRGGEGPFPGQGLHDRDLALARRTPRPRLIDRAMAPTRGGSIPR